MIGLVVVTHGRLAEEFICRRCSTLSAIWRMFSAVCIGP
jgi:mannose/fructose-specific phosphotransferase system component IIA